MKPLTPNPSSSGSEHEHGSELLVSPESARVLRSFRIVFNAVKRHFREIEKRTSLGGAQLWALSLIAERPQLGVTALAKAMDIRQSTASNLVKTLIDQGYVSVTRGSADRRTTLLGMLPAGADILRRAPGPFSGVLPQALARLDPDTLSNLERDLGRLIAVLAADPDAARTPLSEL